MSFRHARTDTLRAHQEARYAGSVLAKRSFDERDGDDPAQRQKHKRQNGPEPSWTEMARRDEQLQAEFAARPVQQTDRDNVAYLEWVSKYAAYAMRPLQAVLSRELAGAHAYWSALAGPWPEPGGEDGKRQRHARAMQQFLQLRRISRLDNFFAVAYEQQAADEIRARLREPPPPWCVHE